MRTEKRRFFEGQVVFDLLSHIVAENNQDLKKQNTVGLFPNVPFSSSSRLTALSATQFWKMVDQAISLAEARQLLLPANAGESLLGLTHSSLYQKVFFFPFFIFVLAHFLILHPP